MPSLDRVLRRGLRLLLLALPVSAGPLCAQDAETLEALSRYRLTMPDVRAVLEAGARIDAGPDGAVLRRETQRMDMSIDERRDLRAPPLEPGGHRAQRAQPEGVRHGGVVALVGLPDARPPGGSPCVGGPLPPPPAHVPEENVEFVRQHQDEIARLANGG